MSTFLPFRGIRYGTVGADIGAVASPPYDVIDEEERAALEARDARNSVRLNLPRDDGDTDRYHAAAAHLTAWRADGTLACDRDPRFYRYSMRFRDEDGHLRTTVGAIGALALPRPGEPSPVLPHEETLPKAKSDRLALLQATRANLDPIWGLSLAPGLSQHLEAAGEVLASCTDPDGVEHELRALTGDATALSAAVDAAPVVIADGHHRFETATSYLAERLRDGTAAPTDGAILALVVELADEQLCVRSIHRVVTGLGDIDLRPALADAFAVEARGPNTPEGVAALRLAMHEAGGLGLVDREGLAVLIPDPAALAPLVADRPEAVRDLDATRFETAVRPRLGRADVAYRADAGLVAALVDKGSADAAVLTRPVSVEQIRAAATAGVRMPQKTSYFFPKPRTGMVFRSLDD